LEPIQTSLITFSSLGTENTRKTPSINFLLSVVAGVFVGLAASAFISALTIYAQTGGLIQNNASFAVNAIAFLISLVLAYSLYRRYKILNAVQDFAEIQINYQSSIRPYDVLKRLQWLLEESELKEMGHSFLLSPVVQEMKGVRSGSLSIKRRDYIVFPKVVASVKLTEGQLTVRYALDVEGDTALAVLRAKLNEMAEKKTLSLI
jgi:hypothetical protein